MRLEEIPLSGGNVQASVVRVGDTVRRPAGPWTPAVHAFLEHLHAAGFRGSPRPLGFDAQGREVLTFVPGEAVWPDHFELVGPLDKLARVARLIHDLHDASTDFAPPPDARWQVLVPPERNELIVHHDLAPWNLIVGTRWVFIDWDNAGPGSRLWDLAYAVHGFIPLSGSPHWQRNDAELRLRTFADAYGLDESGRRELIPMLSRRTRAVYDFLRTQAALGVQPWKTHWETGHGDVWYSDTEYIERNEGLWRTALLDET